MLHITQNQPFNPNHQTLVDCLNNGPFKDYILAFSASSQLCPDMHFLSSLMGIATATNGKLGVCGHNGHSEKVQLFIVGINESGERKSASVEEAKRPLVKWVNDGIYSNEEGSTQSSRELFFQNVTSAGLRLALYKKNGRLVHHEPEATLLELMSRKDFSKTDLNNAFCGEPIKETRATRKPINIPFPAVSICILSPKEPVMNFIIGKQKSSSDLINRFLFYFCQNMAGARITNPPQMRQEQFDCYTNKINNLLAIPFPDELGKRHTLRLDFQAAKEFESFAAWAEAALLPCGDLNFAVGWGSKFPAQILKIAALLHCVDSDDPINNPMPLATLQQALRMHSLLIKNTKWALFYANNGRAIDVSGDIQKWISAAHITSFKKSQLVEFFPQFKKKELDAAIGLMEQSGVIQQNLKAYHDASINSGRGRGASAVYNVNWGGWR